MAGEPPAIQISAGILRTRDLVELYYQGRMVVQVKSNQISISTGAPTQILQQDPRRIRYELIFEQFVPTASAAVDIGTPTEIAQSTSMEFILLGESNYTIIRDFRSDMEGVCIELSAQPSVLTGAPSVTVSSRETFLTPLPVDELP